jgi:hypothetical protein
MSDKPKVPITKGRTVPPTSTSPKQQMVPKKPEQAGRTVPPRWQNKKK